MHAMVGRRRTRTHMPKRGVGSTLRGLKGQALKALVLLVCFTFGWRVDGLGWWRRGRVEAEADACVEDQESCWVGRPHAPRPSLPAGAGQGCAGCRRGLAKSGERRGGAVAAAEVVAKWF